MVCNLFIFNFNEILYILLILSGLPHTHGFQGNLGNFQVIVYSCFRCLFEIFSLVASFSIIQGNSGKFKVVKESF